MISSILLPCLSVECPGFLHLVSHPIRSALRGIHEKTATGGRNLGPPTWGGWQEGEGPLNIWSRNRHVVQLVEPVTHYISYLNERINANAVCILYVKFTVELQVFGN